MTLQPMNPSTFAAPPAIDSTTPSPVPSVRKPGKRIPTERRPDMFKKILLPLDGSAMSERAIDAAEEMAKGSGAEVLLLKVVPSPLGKAPEAGQAEESKAFTESVNRSKAYLEKFAARLGKNSVRSRILIPSGEPYAEILAAAHKEDVDCIVMSTHGGTALARVLLGSTAEKVVYTTKRPVLLIKPKEVLAAHLDEGEVFAGVAR
jgi:nucleotide-binding universal stress UspA family protein